MIHHPHMATKQDIATILDVEVCPGWDIIDSLPEENLYLVHYNEGYGNRFGHLRGTVVDTSARVIVCQSFGYTKTATTNKIIEEENGDIIVEDDDKEMFLFEKDQMMIKIGYEGVIIRVFKHNGNIYRCTHKKLNPIKSRWGPSEFFITMYENLKGPKDELFEEGCRFSPWVYMFLVVDPMLLVGTRQNTQSGYLVYLGNRKMKWGPEFSDTEVGVREEKPLYSLPEKTEIVTPELLSLKQANVHLESGFYLNRKTNDERLKSGEFVIFYKLKDGEVVELLKIQSVAYSWRVGLRANKDNLSFQFHNLLMSAEMDPRNPDEVADFKKKFPILPLYAPADLKSELENGPILSFEDEPVDEASVIAKKIDRIHLIWLAFFLSVPPVRQNEVVNFFNDAIDERRYVADWIVAMVLEKKVSLDQIKKQEVIKHRDSSDSDEHESESCPIPTVVHAGGKTTKIAPMVRGECKKTSIKDFVPSKRFLQIADQASGNRGDLDRTFGIKTVTDKVFETQVHNLLQKERGNTLYKLAREMRKYLEAQERAVNCQCSTCQPKPE